MKMRLAACSIAFAATALFGAAAPAVAQAETTSTVTGEYTAQEWYYHGAYRTLAQCEAEGEQFRDQGYSTSCRLDYRDGRSVYELWVLI